MFICKFCGREGKSNKSNWIHQSRCDLNPEKYTQPKNKGSTGVKAWNNGRADLPKWSHSDETKHRLSEIAKERGIGGYIPGSGRGKQGWYKGFFCDSSWELAYVIYCLDHGLSIERNKERRKYKWEGKEHFYIPDFIVNGELIEIKGFKTEQWNAKHLANPDVKVLYEKDLTYVFDFVKEKYGKDFVRLYENTESLAESA